MPERRISNANFVADEPRQGWAFFEDTGQWRKTPQPWGAPKDHFPKELGDWVAVSGPLSWRPPAGTRAGEALPAAGGVGYKLGKGGHGQQAYDSRYGEYEGEGGGSSGPVFRGKVNPPYEVRGKVTPPEKPTYPPPPPAPSQPHLTWDQGKGVLRDEQGRVMTDKGYSGKGDAKNNSAQEHLEDRGPIPQGNWRVTEIRTRPIVRT